MQRGSGQERAAGDGFWRFSLALYARSRAAEALLKLQDRANGNVNLILFGLWLGAVRGERLDDARLAAAVAAIAEIDGKAVVPLRQLRRRLQETDEPLLQVLRRRISAAELAAERQAQIRLAASVAGWLGGVQDGDRLAAAAGNLALYLGCEANSVEAAVLRETVAELMRAPR
jgi:uncharacterized protein (TIGR02444 family)